MSKITESFLYNPRKEIQAKNRKSFSSEKANLLKHWFSNEIQWQTIRIRRK
jgi:hypothetical protein